MAEGLRLVDPDLHPEVAEAVERVFADEEADVLECLRLAFHHGYGVIGQVVPSRWHRPIMPMSASDANGAITGWRVVNLDPDGGAELVVPVATNPFIAVQEGLFGSRLIPRERETFGKPLVPGVKFRLGTHGSSPDPTSPSGCSLRVRPGPDHAMREMAEKRPNKFVGSIALVQLPEITMRKPFSDEPGRVALPRKAKTLGRVLLRPTAYLALGEVDTTYAYSQ